MARADVSTALSRPAPDALVAVAAALRAGAAACAVQLFPPRAPEFHQSRRSCKAASGGRTSGRAVANGASHRHVCLEPFDLSTGPMAARAPTLSHILPVKYYPHLALEPSSCRPDCFKCSRRKGARLRPTANPKPKIPRGAPASGSAPAASGGVDRTCGDGRRRDHDSTEDPAGRHHGPGHQHRAQQQQLQTLREHHGITTGAGLLYSASRLFAPSRRFEGRDGNDRSRPV